MANQFNMYSFKQFCIDTGNEKYLDLWDYELNTKDPDEVGYSSKVNRWMKCPRGLHESSSINILMLSKTASRNGNFVICKKCNSIGQYIIDAYGKEYLDNIWSDKNELSYYDISHASNKRIWLKCLTDETHPDYDLYAGVFMRTHGCPYCAGDRVCYTNSLGYKYPDAVKYWSDKNELTPYDYTSGSKAKVWFKCPDGIHEDYQRGICDQLKVQYRCPICSVKLVSGENNYRWKGGVSTEHEKIRHSVEYRKWQKEVYKRDNYICQCCTTKTKKLEGHHLKDFATHEYLRFEISNGISLCKFCHNANATGSFHNIYGVFQKTEKELEEYINYKRKLLGIHIPFSIDEFKDGNIITKDDIKDLDRYYFPYKESKEKRNKNFINIKPRFRIKEECNYG